MKNYNSTKKILIASAVVLSTVFSCRLLFADSCEIGAFVGNADHHAATAADIQNFESLAGRHIASNLVYWAFNDGDFPTQELNDGLRYHDGYNTQSVLHLTWEPWSRSGASDDSYTLSHIAAGQYDDYITKFAQDCRQWQDPIRLRFAHEMISVAGSASWYPWQDKPTEYIAAWQHVRQIFRDQNATNVEFVWAPNSYPADLETLRQYYPGAENVDWLGMDGYNPGEDGLPGYPYWQNFDDLFFNLYNVMVDHPEVFGDKKIMLAEFASAELDAYGTRTKAEWIFNAFQAIKERYSEIEAFYWFNTLKEADWRIDSSADSLFAFQTVMQDPYFTSHVIPEPNMLVLFGTGLVYMVGKRNNKQERG